MWRIPHMGHCRDEGGVCNEKNRDVDALGGLAGEPAKGPGR